MQQTFLIHLKVRKGIELGFQRDELGAKAKGQMILESRSLCRLVLPSELIKRDSDRSHSLQLYLDDLLELKTVSRRVIQKPSQMTEALECRNKRLS